MGDTVRVPVPEVDRGKGDSRNILGVVVKITSDGLFKIGTRCGFLNNLFSRNQFTKCKEKLVSLEIPNRNISVRTASTEMSVGTGQGFVKCTCTKRCVDKHCGCRQKNRKCNSKYWSETCYLPAHNSHIIVQFSRIPRQFLQCNNHS